MLVDQALIIGRATNVKRFQVGSFQEGSWRSRLGLTRLFPPRRGLGRPGAGSKANQRAADAADPPKDDEGYRLAAPLMVHFWGIG